MSGDGRPAVFVGTMLETGDAVALCDICLVGWAAAVLNTMTGVDPEPFLRAVSEPDDVPTAAEGAPTDEPPAPAPADSDPEAASGPEASGATEPPESSAKGRRRAESASGRTSRESPGPGTDAGPAANGTAAAANKSTPAA